MRRTLLPMLMLLAACSATPPDEAEPSASDEPVPSASMQLPALLPSPAPDGEVVHGWPDTSENEAGVYSWDGPRCSSYCLEGFMHNGYGSGDVTIRIALLPEGAIPDDGDNAVTVAGHDAIHRGTDARLQAWYVDIEGTTIAIRLAARPGTSEADLAEAHAIIDSMRTEAVDNDLGLQAGLHAHDERLGLRIAAQPQATEQTAYVTSAINTNVRRWQQMRMRVLIRDHHTCQLQLHGCTKLATQVDHS